MTDTRKLLSCIMLGLALTACSGEDPDADVMSDGGAAKTDATAPTSPAPAAPIDPTPEVVKPVTVSNDAITLGTTVQDGRVVKAPRAQFTLADTVRAGVAGGGHPAGAETRIYWTYQDGLSHKEETKPLTAEGVVFEFSRSDGMKPGRYTVQVDVGPTPIGLVDFEVR